MVDIDPIAAWEQAYHAYGEATETDVASTSRAVAAAWRGLVAGAELPWWLLAAVHSAAEAFDRQAEAWEAASAHNGAGNGRAKKPGRTRYVWPAVVLPAARRPANGWQVLADTTPNGSDNGHGRTEAAGDG